MILPFFSNEHLQQGTLELPHAQLRLDLDGGITAALGERFKTELPLSGLDLLRADVTSDPIPLLRVWLDPECLPTKAEGYRIEINPGEITLSSSTEAGLGFGCTSLRLLLAHATRSGNTLQLQTGIIEDWPKYSWRGMHLDVSRHFFTVAEIKCYLDILALHKINRFHWHLTDDQGWRLEIPALPKLTSIGAWRREPDGSEHGGFYRAEEVREVVSYAEHLGIQVVPEIDVPGHLRSAIASYPELCCTGERQPVPNTWGVFEDVLCVGRESSFDFIKTVFDHVCDLFPGPWIHIGGDEVPTTRWQTCPHCQRRIVDEFLLGTESLQGWFTTRAADFVASKGKTVIGWDEVLAGDPPKEMVIMSWRGVEQGVEAAKKGYPVVMSPARFCYFDHSQGESGEPEAFPAVLPLERVYEFSPAPSDLSLQQQSCIIGGQANLWTERIVDPKHLEYMLLPRLTALANVLWHGNDEGFETFKTTLQPHLALLGQWGYNYRPLD